MTWKKELSVEIFIVVSRDLLLLGLATTAASGALPALGCASRLGSGVLVGGSSSGLLSRLGNESFGFGSGLFLSFGSFLSLLLRLLCGLLYRFGLILLSLGNSFGSILPGFCSGSGSGSGSSLGFFLASDLGCFVLNQLLLAPVSFLGPLGLADGAVERLLTAHRLGPDVEAHPVGMMAAGGAADRGLTVSTGLVAEGTIVASNRLLDPVGQSGVSLDLLLGNRIDLHVAQHLYKLLGLEVVLPA